jgi:hypothetical protein
MGYAVSPILSPLRALPNARRTDMGRRDIELGNGSLAGACARPPRLKLLRLIIQMGRLPSAASVPRAKRIERLPRGFPLLNRKMVTTRAPLTRSSGRTHRSARLDRLFARYRLDTLTPRFARAGHSCPLRQRPGRCHQVPQQQVPQQQCVCLIQGRDFSTHRALWAGAYVRIDGQVNS